MAACLHTYAQAKHAHAYSKESHYGNRRATQGNNLAESGTHCKKVSCYCRGSESKASENRGRQEMLSKDGKVGWSWNTQINIFSAEKGWHSSVVLLMHVQYLLNKIVIKIYKLLFTIGHLIIIIFFLKWRFSVWLFPVAVYSNERCSPPQHVSLITGSVKQMKAQNKWGTSFIGR